MICEFCKKELSSLSSLNFHKKTAKYCIKIQEKSQDISDIKHSEYKCGVCNKNCTTKNNLTSHMNISCGKDIYKINTILCDKINTIESIKRQLEDVKNELQSLKKDNDDLKNEIKLLTRMNEIYETDHKCVQDIAKQPKTINNTNNTLNISPIDFNDISKLKNTIEENYNMNYMFLGQKGIARFAYDFVLKDNEGNLNYVCTDASRFGFKYKDEYGEIRKDTEAKKLTSYLLNGGIKTKACDMASEWWTDDNGETNTGKFELLINKAESMRLLEEDNSEFKKELAAITSV